MRPFSEELGEVLEGLMDFLMVSIIHLLLLPIAIPVAAFVLLRRLWRCRAT